MRCHAHSKQVQFKVKKTTKVGVCLRSSGHSGARGRVRRGAGTLGSADAEHTHTHDTNTL